MVNRHALTFVEDGSFRVNIAFVRHATGTGVTAAKAKTAFICTGLRILYRSGLAAPGGLRESA